MNERHEPWYENFDVVFWSWIVAIYVAIIVGLLEIIGVFTNAI